MDDPGDPMSLKSRLAREARYTSRGIAEMVRWFWHGGSGPTDALALAGGA